MEASLQPLNLGRSRFQEFRSKKAAFLGRKHEFLQFKAHNEFSLRVDTTKSYGAQNWKFLIRCVGGGGYSGLTRKFLIAKVFF